MSSKKVIAMPAGRWARELLTLSGADRIEYFLDDDMEARKKGFPAGNRVIPVYPVEHVLSENPQEIVIVITDTGMYAECRERLTACGLRENTHFFDGWHLNIRFYRMLDEGITSWTQYEKSIGKFDYSEYSGRAGKMASLIPEDVTSVMDMGCGDEILRKYLKPGIRYYGLDIVRRTPDTIVCDANSEKLPDIPVDLYYMAGFLMYMNDVDQLFAGMRGAKYLIFDLWCYAEYRRYGNIYLNIYTRRARAVSWNSRDDFLPQSEVIRALSRNGFAIESALELNRTGTYICYRARNLNRS